MGREHSLREINLLIMQIYMKTEREYIWYGSVSLVYIFTIEIWKWIDSFSILIKKKMYFI